MPLDAEFKQHLHSLMVEVYERTHKEAEQHKRELVFKAQQTHNSAAMPLAYKDAKLYEMELRVGKTIEKYVEAAGICGFAIDAAFERDMILAFWSLTSGPSTFQLPPAIRGQHVQAVQASYARERSRLASQLVREGTNRLKELKMKTKRANNTTGAKDGVTNNTIFNAPVGTAFINSSVVQTTNNNITISTQILDDIDRLSEGNVELQSAARELRTAHAQNENAVDKLQRWVTLANTVTGLAGTIHQHYPQIAHLIERLREFGS
jgi:hypothetical protein